MGQAHLRPLLGGGVHVVMFELGNDSPHAEDFKIFPLPASLF